MPHIDEKPSVLTSDMWSVSVSCGWLRARQCSMLCAVNGVDIMSAENELLRRIPSPSRTAGLRAPLPTVQSA